MSEEQWIYKRNAGQASCENCEYFRPVGMLTENRWGVCIKDTTRSVIKRKRHYCFLYKGNGITPEDTINSLESRIENLEKTIKRFKEALDQKLSAREDTVYDVKIASQRWVDDLAKSIQRKDTE